MKNFKAGQKVVYDDKGQKPKTEGYYPPNGAIVRLKCKCEVYFESWDIYGYEVDPKDGEFQSFNENVLHPLEDYFKEQTESVVEKLESELQIEIPELV